MDKKRKKVFINIGITIAVIIFAAILGIVVGELLLDNLIYEEKNKNNTLEYTIRYRVYRQCFNQSKFARFGTYEADAGQMGRYRRDDLQRLKL